MDTVTPLEFGDEPIEAAAKAIYGAWVEAAHPAMRTLARREEWAEQACVLAAIALAAAGSSEGAA